MPSAYDDSRYLARTFAASLLDLAPDEQFAVVDYLRDELRRFSIPGSALSVPGETTITPFPHDSAHDDRSPAQVSGSKRG